MPGPIGSVYEPRVFTGALAIIEYQGVAIGKIRSITFTENLDRLRVQGLGEIIISEWPVTTMVGSFQAESYLIEMRKFGDIIDPFWPDGASTTKEFTDTLLLAETPVNLHIYSKIPDTWNGDIVTSTKKFKMGICSRAYLNTRTFTVSESQLAGKNLSGYYCDPLKF